MILAAFLAQNDNGTGDWMQLLIFIVIAVFYFIANLFKSKQEKQQEQEEFEMEPVPRPHERKGPVKPVPSEKQIKKTAKTATKIFSHKLQEAKQAVSRQEAEIKLEPIYEQQHIEPERIVPELELHNTDELTKGIIYSEVLGKPLALRQNQAGD